MEIKTLYGNLTKIVNFWAFLLKIFDILDSFFNFLNKKFDFWWCLWQPFLLPTPQIVRRRRVPLSCSGAPGSLYVYGKTYTELRIRITYTSCVVDRPYTTCAVDNAHPPHSNRWSCSEPHLFIRTTYTAPAYTFTVYSTVPIYVYIYLYDLCI